MKEGIETGNGIPTLTSISYVTDALKNAGFEIEIEKDMHLNVHDKSEIPWYSGLDGKLSLEGFRMSRKLTTLNY